MYLDNATTSWPKPKQVAEKINDYLLHIGGSPSRSSYSRSKEVEEIVYQTRQKLAQLINTPYPSQFVLTSNATHALNLAITGHLTKGDHVISTVTEHNSVIRPLMKLKKEKLIDVSWCSCDKSGLIDPEEIASLIQPHTKMIIVNHVSNVLGTIQPVEEIGKIAKQHGLTYLLDVSQSLGHLNVNYETIQADLIACSGHKGIYGPSGTGFLYISPNTDIKPIVLGGTGVLSEIIEQPEAMPMKYESGTLNTVGIFGLHAALDFVLTTAIETIREHETKLVRKIYNGLKQLEDIGIEVLSSENLNAGIVSFNVSGYLPDRIGYLLDKHFDVQVRSGLHCAPLIHTYIGSAPYGTIRVSPSYFTTDSEIDQFLTSVKTLVSMLPKGNQLKLPKMISH